MTAEVVKQCKESKTKDCSASLPMSPWTKQVHLGAAKLLSNYFTCRKRRENIQPCNPNVKWLLELLKKSWPLLPPIQIIVYFAFFLSQTSLPWTNLFCFFSKSNFSTATNSYACIGSCSGRGDWWQRVTLVWSTTPQHAMHAPATGRCRGGPDHAPRGDTRGTPEHASCTGAGGCPCWIGSGSYPYKIECSPLEKHSSTV